MQQDICHQSSYYLCIHFDITRETRLGAGSLVYILQGLGEGLQILGQGM